MKAFFFLSKHIALKVDVIGQENIPFTAGKFTCWGIEGVNKLWDNSLGFGNEHKCQGTAKGAYRSIMSERPLELRQVVQRELTVWL